MRVTLADIAEKTGVTKSVISLHLNKDPRSRLSEDKKRLIDQVVSELGYRPSPIASALRTGRSGMLGMVVGGITDLFFSHLVEACLMYGELRNYQMLISLTKWEPEKERIKLDKLLDRQVDGILYAPSWQEDALIANKMAKLRIPILLINQKADHVLTALADYAAAYREMMVMLLKNGHKKLVSCTYNYVTDLNIIKACQQTGLEPLIYHYSSEKIQDESNSYKQMLHELLKSQPSALFVDNCKVAGRFVQMIRENQNDYGPEIITTYHFPDDYIDDPLVTGYLYGDFFAVVKAGINLLIDYIETADKSALTCCQQIPAQFFPREQFERCRDSLIDTTAKAERLDT